MYKNVIKFNNGITLIALVITIIVLLILAGVSIAMLTGDNGILTQGNNAKIETAVGAIKEQLKLLQAEKKIRKEKLTPETLLAEGKVSRTVKENDDEKYYMYYALKEKSFEGMQGLGKGNITNLKDVFLIDDNLNVKYIANNGKEYGDEIKEKILEDETEIRFSSKAFSEYVSKISGISEDEMKFKWMKNQKNLIITDNNITTLNDLVFFPNLEILTLGDLEKNSPSVTSMNGIENCSKLKTLTIYYGPNKDYSAVSKLSNLVSFFRTGGNDFENIIDALKLCYNIQTLSIKYCNITNMSKISEISDNLKSLDLAGNSITEIKGLNNKVNLNSINLESNNISKIEGLEMLYNLKTLSLWNNHIEDITPLSANKNLISLNLMKNKEIDGNLENYTGQRLESLNEIGKILDNGGTIKLDIDKLGLFSNYKKLDLSFQYLTTLKPLENLTQLTYLNLNNSNLTLEDVESQEILKNMSELSTLNLEGNKLKNITAINELKMLKELNLAGNEVNLKEIEDIISNLNSLTVSTSSLKTIINCDINKITTLRLAGSNLTELPDLSKFIDLTDLSLANNPNISNFNMLSKIKNLKSLNLSNNNLHGRMIAFYNLTKLTDINLSHNALWSEDLNNLKVLKNNSNLSINLSNNAIIDATALLELNANTKIDLTGNVNLSQESKDKLKSKFGYNVIF